MRRISVCNMTQGRGILAGDGAELPLLRPRVLAQLSREPKERRTSNSEGDCLILSDDGLDRFDTQRLAEVRGALSGQFRVYPYGRDYGPARPGTGAKHIVLTLVMIALAVAVGMTIGSVL